MSRLENIHDHHITLESSTIMISYIRSMGGCHSEECDRIPKEIWVWAIGHKAPFTVAKPARQFSHAMQIFLCFIDYKRNQFLKK